MNIIIANTKRDVGNQIGISHFLERQYYEILSSQYYLKASRFSASSLYLSLYYLMTVTLVPILHVSVQFSRSVVSHSLRPHGLQHAGLPVHHWLPELTQTHVHWVSDAIQPSHPLLSPSPAFNHSSIRVFSNESVLWIRWPKYWSFSFSISPSSDYPGLISFRIHWLDLLAVQGTLKIISNTTVQKHQFFGAQLSL